MEWNLRHINKKEILPFPVDSEVRLGNARNELKNEKEDLVPCLLFRLYR